MNILEKLISAAGERVERDRAKVPLPEIIAKSGSVKLCGYEFEEKLKAPGLSLICEIKRASPSKGIISKDFPYIEIAKDYEAGGAAAISVLTETDYFLGSDRYLEAVAQTVNLPVLRKDFIVDAYQIYQAKALGAKAVLLICAALEDKRLKDYIALAHVIGLSALVEAHDEWETEAALKAGARVIGVNNRDLKTFNVDIRTSAKLRRLVPDNVLFVAESGIESASDIAFLAENKADAALVGETLMRSGDRAAALWKLTRKSGGKSPVKVKICGLSRREDIASANIALPDYIGFVFAESPRRVTAETAAELKKHLNPNIKSVGVFVNEAPENIAALSKTGTIDIVQLHGDEDDDYIKNLKAILKNLIIKTVAIGGESPLETAEADYLLFDSYDKDKRGGSGRAFNWDMVNSFSEKPFFLAGGLNEANLTAAAQINPFALDISSGAETDGVKDREKMIKIVKIVRGI
jgi:indole-3-glycerol phosphate synthase/phosphoribosylanthranilate isomerase/anthranilate synthase/indole-3-glycerol phosphate synthase/phosphoribosylanthranilate isomerase